jgi:hypothetical protein
MFTGKFDSDSESGDPSQLKRPGVKQPLSLRLSDPAPVVAFRNGFAGQCAALAARPARGQPTVTWMAIRVIFITVSAFQW